LVREGRRSFLAEQIKAGVASDQRAINTAGLILRAVLAAIVGGYCNVIVSVKIEFGLTPDRGRLADSLPSFCFWLHRRSCRTSNWLFSIVDTNPARWVPDITEGRALHDFLWLVRLRFMHKAFA